MGVCIHLSCYFSEVTDCVVGVGSSMTACTSLAFESFDTDVDGSMSLAPSVKSCTLIVLADFNDAVAVLELVNVD